ncbi:hypothetical protein [Naumannella cuiyingiana]|uniref:hypothetical protein n=1 Tax=Naumannella cuiyingiana TaxID=1347891 RepID=UPI0015CA2802|nr:hypothetical protein [Naumannella cuiyingiana]
MNFAGKVDLAHGLGAIESDDVGWFRELNNMRDRLAHDLSGTPTQHELETLAASVVRFPRAILDGALDLSGHVDASGRGRLSTALLVRLILLEYWQMHETWRRNNQDSLIQYRLQRALLRIGPEGVTPEMDAALRSQCGVKEPRPTDAVDLPESEPGIPGGPDD